MWGHQRLVRLARITTLLLGVVLFPPTALACLWDSDTLRAEARGLPGLVDILTGRFEREPDLYYEMRLARVSAAIEASPDDIALYDDAGVACDRLGRHDEAIAWMARKRERLDLAVSATEGAADAAKEHEYRYLANLGTFHAHRWLAGGADREAMGDLAVARDLIAAAIELNPDAHFGREAYQLMAIEWLQAPPEEVGYDAMAISSIFDRAIGYRGVNSYALHRAFDAFDVDDAVEGLSGLIVLGAAWESIDIIYSLSLVLERRGDNALAYLAILRCIELASAGRGTLDPRGLSASEIAGGLRLEESRSMVAGEIDSFFPRARRAADEWREHREAFMMERLLAGRHPDTDPAFWDGYVPVAALTPPNGVFGLAGYDLQIALLIGGFVVPVSLVILLFVVQRARKRAAVRRAQSAIV